MLALTLVSSLALGQLAPGADPGAVGLGAMPPAVKLTKDSVERLLKAIPEVTKEGSAQHQRMMASGEAQAKPEDLQRMQTIFTKHGFTMEDFALQMSTMIATYMTLDPTALDAQIPSESSPEVKKVLADPALTPEQRQIIRDQVKQAQDNKELLRAQFAKIATEDNKKAVKPFLPQIKKVLADAQEEALRVLKPGMTPAVPPGPTAGPGPRRRAP